MANELLAADTLVPVTNDLVNLARNRLGMTPLFWGRYFKRPDFAEDYQPAKKTPSSMPITSACCRSRGRPRASTAPRPWAPRMRC